MANKKFEEAIVFYFSSNSHQLLFSDILFELQKLGNRKLTIYSALFPIDNEGNNLLSHDRFNDIELIYPGPVRKFYEIKSRLFRIKFSCTELFDYFFSEFKKIQPGCVVLGNDTGHIERSIIRAAKCLKIRTVLMQDGYIYNAIKSPFFLNCLKLWGQFFGRLVGRVPYGMMGCDTILCYSEFYREKFFTKKQKNTTEILVLGYPNPGIKGKGPRKLEKCRPVVYFATNFQTSVLAGFQKKRMHEHQIKEIIELRASLDKRFQKNQLIVKLHPADHPNNYIALRSIKNIKISTTLDLLQIIENSLFCVANFSTVAVQCFRSKKLCLVGSVNLNRGAFVNFFQEIPGVKFHNWKEFETYMEMIDHQKINSLITKQTRLSSKVINNHNKAHKKIASFLEEYSKANSS